MSKSKDLTDSTAKAVVSTLKSIGIANSFFDGLLKSGDDWTFVIKVHALLETALTHLLVSELERQELTEIFANIEMSNARTGKVAFAKELGLLGVVGRRFVRKFSELRNDLVHDVRNTSFSFGPIPFSPGSTSSNDLQRTAWSCIDAASEFFKEKLEFSGRRVSRKDFARQKPRLAIWFAVYFVLAEIYHQVAPDDLLVRALLKVRRRQPNKAVNSGAPVS